MSLQQNIFGDRYETDEPCFLTTEAGTFVFNRVRRQWYSWAELVAKATAESYTWKPREVGIPSIMWQFANSLANGQRWAPGLDSTDGLASEAVTNGDEFTGASNGGPGPVPPTGWTRTGDGLFNLFPSVLNIEPDPVTGGGMTQELTLTPGTYYVCEILLMVDTNGGRVTLSDSSGMVSLPVKGPTDGQNSEINAFSFMATEANMTIGFAVAPGELISVDHIRVFEEAELTGNPGTGGVNVPTPTPPAFEVLGPYQAGETVFFIQKFADASKECMVWLDVDSDPDPDVALTKQQVCESEINDQAKMAIDAQLKAVGCSGLPCVKADGTLKKKYQQDDGGD